MFRQTHLLATTLLLSASLAFADSMPLDADPVVDPDEDRSALELATCEDVFTLFAEATPEEGKDPAELARAQDDLLYFTTWVHGYLSGLHGIDEEKRPMGREGVVELINRMAEVCEPDKSKRFLEAARSID